MGVVISKSGPGEVEVNLDTDRHLSESARETLLLTLAGWPEVIPKDGEKELSITYDGWFRCRVAIGNLNAAKREEAIKAIYQRILRTIDELAQKRSARSQHPRFEEATPA